jgi:hypothetical protein
MPGTTPEYGWRYQELADAPDGAGLGEDLAGDIETTVKAIDERNATGGTVSSGANTATFTNTSAAVQAPNIGMSFVAPPSGRILLVGHFYLRNRNALYAVYGGVRIKTGSTLDAGSTVHDPSTEPNAKVSLQQVVGQMEASAVQIVTGLTPGATYNACCVGWVDNASGGGDHYSRRIEVVNL